MYLSALWQFYEVGWYRIPSALIVFYTFRCIVIHYDISCFNDITVTRLYYFLLHIMDIFYAC